MKQKKLLAAAIFFFSGRRRHTISLCDWSSDVCSSVLLSGDEPAGLRGRPLPDRPARLAGGDGARDRSPGRRVRNRGPLAGRSRLVSRRPRAPGEIGRAAWRERVEISVAPVSLKKKKNI